MPRPLIVAATRAEAAHVPEGLDVVICGIGKVDATIVTVRAVLEHRPSCVVNIGTAGALRAGLAGLTVPSRVVNHDLSAELVRALGHECVDELDVAGGDGTVLATGDTFVTDSTLRDRLAQRADLVDMEGFAIAAAASRLGVQCRLVKHISDSADESAMSWPEVVDASARVLGQWLVDSL